MASDSSTSSGLQRRAGGQIGPSSARAKPSMVHGHTLRGVCAQRRPALPGPQDGHRVDRNPDLTFLVLVRISYGQVLVNLILSHGKVTV